MASNNNSIAVGNPIKDHIINGINLKVYSRRPQWKSLNHEQEAVEIKVSQLSNTWKGTPGAGVFATRQISAGEVVFTEDAGAASMIAFERTPNLGIINGLTPNMILDAFKAAMPETWDIVVGRNYTWPDSEAVTNLEWNSNAMPLPAAAMTAAEFELRCSRLVAIFRSNAITVQSTVIFGGPTGGPDGEGTIFTLRTAYINHCCVPNIAFSWAGKGSPLIVRAIKVIQPGEEILRSYVDECQTSTARGMLLKSHHGITCQCRACLGEFAEEADRRRQILVTVKQQLYQNAMDMYEGKGDVLSPAVAARLYHVAITLLNIEPSDCLIDMKLEILASLASIYRNDDIAKCIDTYCVLLDVLKLREGHETQRFNINAWLLGEALHEERKQMKAKKYTEKEWEKLRVALLVDPVTIKEFAAGTSFLVMLTVLLAKLRRREHDADAEVD